MQLRKPQDFIFFIQRIKTGIQCVPSLIFKRPAGSTGQIILEGEVYDEADISCNIGEVLYTVPGEPETYDYEVTCGIGEVVIGSEAYSGLNDKLEIDNGSGTGIRADCGLGRIEIIFE